MKKIIIMYSFLMLIIISAGSISHLMSDSMAIIAACCITIVWLYVIYLLIQQILKSFENE